MLYHRTVTSLLTGCLSPGPGSSKPSIVFVHGLWADGSCLAKLIPTLPKEDFEESHPSTVWTHMLEMSRTSRGLSVESASPRSWSVTLMEDQSSLPLARSNGGLHGAERPTLTKRSIGLMSATACGSIEYTIESDTCLSPADPGIIVAAKAK
jgi:hypothetical protein